LFAATAGRAEDPKSTLEKAASAYQKHDLDKALTLADDVLKADPKNAEAHFLRGKILLDQRKLEDSVAALTRTIELVPQFGPAYDSRGAAQFKLARIKESLADFDMFIKLDPSKAAAHWRRGLTLYYAAKFADGVRMVATGEGAHYPMLTFAIGAIAQDYPEKLKDVGFFAMPGDDAAKNGLTVWMPAAVYIAKTTQHPDEARKFVAMIASKKGCDIRSTANGATGPYLIKGCTLPASVPPSVTAIAS